MTIITLDTLDLFPMMASRTILLVGLPMVLPRRMAASAFQPVSRHMGFMRKLDIVERDRTPLHPNVTEGGTGHLGPEFLGLIGFIDNPKGLFALIISRVEKLEGILDVMNALAQQNTPFVV